jgi:uncharacterized protein (TIGR00303 family)
VDNLSITFHGNVNNAEKIIQTLSKKRFTFGLVTSYSETCEIPGITIAGADKEFLKFTAPADSEYIEYGKCVCIPGIPISPDGKPTPALLTRVSLNAAKIPHFVVNAGSKVRPSLCYFDADILPGKNIYECPAMSVEQVKSAIQYGKQLGKIMSQNTDCLVIGECVPGGTTTALAVLRAFGLECNVSSSMQNNPLDLKNKVVSAALKRKKSDNALEIIANFGDPMMPVCAGMLSSASKKCNVILAGGTQMLAVLQLAKIIGYNVKNSAIGCTSYIIDDSQAKFLDTVKQIDDIAVLSCDPCLHNSQHFGLRSYADGFVKEGAGAGGAIIASLLKTENSIENLFALFEQEYERIST